MGLLQHILLSTLQLMETASQQGVQKIGCMDHNAPQSHPYFSDMCQRGQQITSPTQESYALLTELSKAKPSNRNNQLEHLRLGYGHFHGLCLIISHIHHTIQREIFVGEKFLQISRIDCDSQKYSPRTFCIYTLGAFIYTMVAQTQRSTPTLPHFTAHLVLAITLPRLLAARTSAASSLAIVTSEAVFDDTVLPL